MKNELFTINQYGKITIDIKTFMDEKCINRNMLARAINARFEVIDKWYNGHVDLLATDGMLVKRPLLIGEKTVCVGFREAEWAKACEK